MIVVDVVADAAGVGDVVAVEDAGDDVVVVEVLDSFVSAASADDVDVVNDEDDDDYDLNSCFQKQSQESTKKI